MGAAQPLRCPALGGGRVGGQPLPCPGQRPGPQGPRQKARGQGRRLGKPERWKLRAALGAREESGRVQMLPAGQVTSS